MLTYLEIKNSVNIYLVVGINHISELIDVSPGEEEPKSLLMKVKGKVKNLAENSAFKKLRSCCPVHHFMASRSGKSRSNGRFFFPWASKSLQIVTAVMKLKDVCSLEGKL